MPGIVPLSNSQFINSPDFNNQAIQGITGPGVFRQFSYTSPGGTSLTLQSINLWNMIQMTGNCVITVPGGITAEVGDEIIVINNSGTISFTATNGAVILNDSLYVIPSQRPARLVYAGSNNWLLAGDKRNYVSNTLTDCCDNPQPAGYTSAFSNQSFADDAVYSNRFGTSLYTASAIGGVVKSDGAAYTIVSGNVTPSTCELVSFSYQYILYASETPTNLYSYRNIDINNDAAVLGVPFRTSEGSAYPCDTSTINGTFYRSYGAYGGSNPLCFSNGVIISAVAC
jgi:hypothetical protein